MAYASITKPSLHFNTKLYTGNGGTQSITGVGFQPDWVWIKRRGATNTHTLWDAVRGTTKWIESNSNNAEQTYAGGLTAFGTDGFSIGDGGDINTNSASQVAWNWKANGAGSADTSGTINSTISANTTAGFSIVKYVGDGTGGNNTIAHGLGAVPGVVLYKNLDSARNWIVYHKGIGATKNLYLDLNNSQNTASNTFNNVAPTSTFLNVNDSVGVNESGDNHVAYCFAEIKGYSKFGSYTGNANVDGPFVYTGFKPAFIITKRYNANENWYIKDNKRSVSNPVDEALYANGNNAELTGWSGATTDYLSNGFKVRTTDTAHNGSGDSYLYMAFAEEPLVANVGESIPATAR